MDAMHVPRALRRAGLDDDEVAKRLRMMRKRKNMSQMEVAGKIGVSRTAYLKYESGKGGIPGKSLTQLADLFGTTTDYLLGRNLQEALLRPAVETAAEVPVPIEYIRRPPAYYQLVSLLNTMSDDALEMMLDIAKAVKAHQGEQLSI